MVSGPVVLDSNCPSNNPFITGPQESKPLGPKPQIHDQLMEEGRKKSSAELCQKHPEMTFQMFLHWLVVGSAGDLRIYCNIFRFFCTIEKTLFKSNSTTLKYVFNTSAILLKCHFLILFPLGVSYVSTSCLFFFWWIFSRTFCVYIYPFCYCGLVLGNFLENAPLLIEPFFS